MALKRTTKYKNADSEAAAKYVKLVAMNEKQQDYIDALANHDQLIVLGPSGTGKSYIAATYAANLYLQKKIHKIIITRPNVAVGKELGHLPGTLEEKYSPWLAPILDTLEKHLGKAVVETALKNGNIEMAPLAFMRGRSFDNAFIMMDECFTGDTEVLTKAGWTKLEELQEGIAVAQYTPDSITFVQPSRIIKQQYEGDMVTYKKDRFSMSATAGHNAVYKDSKGNIVVQPFSDKPNTNWSIPTTVNQQSVKPKDNAKVALTCALQADGSFLRTKTSAGNYTTYWTITLSRQRKIDRLEWALAETQTKHTKYEPDKDGKVRYYIPTPDVSLFSDVTTKTFCLESILNQGVANEVLHEVLLWDGSVKNNTKVYCSTNKSNVDTLQAIAHMHGWSANFGVQHDKRDIFKVPPKPYYRLYFSQRNKVTTQKLQKSEYHYNGSVYCVTVPSGMLLVRQNGKVFVSGNCQNTSVEEFKMFITRVGQDCKVVMNGDIKQSDIRGHSGLAKAIELAKKYDIDAAVIEFTLDDVVRSDICKQWLTAFYGEAL